MEHCKKIYWKQEDWQLWTPFVVAVVAVIAYEIQNKNSRVYCINILVPTISQLSQLLFNKSGVGYSKMAAVKLAKMNQKEKYTGDSDDEEMIKDHNIPFANSV